MRARGRFFDSLKNRRTFLRFTTLAWGSLVGGVWLAILFATGQVPPRLTAFAIGFFLGLSYLGGYLFGVLYWKYVMVPIYGFGKATPDAQNDSKRALRNTDRPGAS